MNTTVTFHTLSLDIGKNITLHLNSPIRRGEDALTAELGQTITSSNVDVKQSEEEVQITWPNLGELKIKHDEPGPGNHRYDFAWDTVKAKSLIDGFEMGTGFWYGGAQIKQQEWPINKWKRKSQPFVCGNSFDNDYGGVQERYWLQSNGVALFVDEHVPLFVSVNYNHDRRITFTSKFDSPYKNPQKLKPFLKYTILQSQNVRTVHDFAIEQVFTKPGDIPNEDMFRYPIWSTWAQYKKDINQKIVMEFADKISELGFKTSQIEIDDDWTPSYGDMVFDKKKFPGAHTMVKELKQKGHRVTVWVHPFASPKSSAARLDYWVKGTLGGVSTWWNGLGKSLDVTNPAAVAWFKGCLKNLKDETGIDSFKFDAGEVNWLPSGWKCKQEMSNPNNYTTKYAELCASLDTELRAQEVRVAHRTQHLPIFVRMMDKDSKWDYDNGLQSLIPHALTFSILGYPFILPDMIGGNAYKGMPDKELYIRWLEANALLPSIQYSIVPWQYDDEVIAIAKKMDAIHEKYADLIITLARLATQTGEPIVRPVWWDSPYDEQALTIDSEFLLGEDVLVAPVVQQNARSRSIYLPAGSWKDQNNGNVLSGGRWYHDFAVKLDELPHFVRQERTIIKRKPKEEEPEPEPEVPPEEVPSEEGAGEEEQAAEEPDEGDGGEDGEPGEQPSGPPSQGAGAAPPLTLAEELRQKMQEFWNRKAMQDEGEVVHEGDEMGSAFSA